MIYYRMAIQGSQSAAWRWKSSPPTSPEQMDVMLSRENLGLLSTAVTVDQLWDMHRMSSVEVRRLEVELGAGGDHDYPYTFSLPTLTPQILAWAKLRAHVE